MYAAGQDQGGQGQPQGYPGGDGQSNGSANGQQGQPADNVTDVDYEEVGSNK
jgi:molecular chaperone DnaK